MEENLGEFGKSLVVHQILLSKILTMFRDINKESKQAGICPSFNRQKFLMRNLQIHTIPYTSIFVGFRMQN